MKKIIAAFLLLTVFGLTSCSEGDYGIIEDQFLMKATVTAVNERIEVDVYEAEYAEGIYHLVYDNGTVILDTDGKRISASDIKTGDKIAISYNGQVMMSYPPQVYAIKIVKI